jgi:hypothetical protein
VFNDLELGHCSIGDFCMLEAQRVPLEEPLATQAVLVRGLRRVAEVWVSVPFALPVPGTAAAACGAVPFA